MSALSLYEAGAEEDVIGAGLSDVDRKMVIDAFAILQKAAERDDAHADGLDNIVDRAKAKVTGVQIDTLINNFRQTRRAYNTLKPKYERLLASDDVTHDQAADFARSVYDVSRSTQALSAEEQNSLLNMTKTVVHESVHDFINIPWKKIGIGAGIFVGVIGAVKVYRAVKGQ